MNDAVADFYFFILVHERFCKIGIMAVLDRGATNERRPIRNRLLPGGGGKIFARGQNRGRGADGAHRRHVNVLCCDGDERTGRASVCVDKCVRGDFRLIERVHDIRRAIQSPTIRIHLEDDRGGFVTFGCFDCAP